MNNIKFIALGGLDEKGKNLYCLEINQKIFIFEAGSKKPLKNMWEAGTIIANFDYLIRNKKNIVGIFLSNPVDENIEALPYILKKINVNVYASKLTTYLIKQKLRNLKIMYKNFNFNYVYPKSILKFDDVQIEPFQTTSFFPNTLGYAIYTNEGTIIYSGPFIIDQELNHDYAMDLTCLSTIRNKQDVLLLLIDSSNANTLGYAAPKYRIYDHIKSACEDAKRRVVFACFEQDIFKIDEFLNIMGEQHLSPILKVSVEGKLLFATLTYLQQHEHKYKNIKFYKLEDMPHLKTILVSGNLEKLYASLIKIATGNHENLELKADDTVIITTPPTAGRELNHANVLDEISRTQAKMIALSSNDVYKMNAHYEDIKVLIGVFKPKYVIPIKGLYMNLKAVVGAAQSAGVFYKNSIILNNGEVVLFKKQQATIQKKSLKTSDNYVENVNSFAINDIVLKERKQLSSDGVAVISYALNKKTWTLFSNISIQMQGVIYLKDLSNLNNKIIELVHQINNKFKTKLINKEITTTKDLRYEINKFAGKAIYNETKKNPIVLVVIDEI